MDIEVHRARRTYYVQSTALLNVPHRRLEPFFDLPHWPLLTAAKFLGLRGFAERRFEDFATGGDESSEPARVSGASIEELMRRHDAGELNPEDFIVEMRRLQDQTKEQALEDAPDSVRELVETASGVSAEIWEKVGQELIEYITPFESGQVRSLEPGGANGDTSALLTNLGIGRISLISDFPIITTSYGFTRAEYAPNVSRLNAFPPASDHSGKIPLFVDQVQADAILVEIDPVRLLAWLAAIGQPVGPSADVSSGNSAKALGVQVLHGISLRETIRADEGLSRAAFGLLHTMSHFFLRQAALLCGLDRTSLSEYVLPHALTFAIYCNHRFGATIGALTALFEQTLDEWLTSVTEARHCVYDPVCKDREGSCHACTHLSETSCRFFNLNLGRAFLFGGRDPELGILQQGYFRKEIE